MKVLPAKWKINHPILCGSFLGKSKRNHNFLLGGGGGGREEKFTIVVTHGNFTTQMSEVVNAVQDFDEPYSCYNGTL